MKRLLITLLLFIFILPVKAEVIDFDYVLKQAILNSYDLNISKIDTQISEKGIAEAKSDYFPKMSAYFTSEYSNDLDNGNSQTSYIGNEVLLSGDRYQSATSLGVSYNVFDFGMRKRKVDISKTDKEQKEAIYLQELRDLKINLVDVYAQALMLSKEHQVKQDLLAIESELYGVKERLNVAGEVRKTEVVDSAIKVAKLATETNNIKRDYIKALKELSFYTQKDFSFENVELSDFEKEKEDGNIINVSYKQLPELRLGVDKNYLLVEDSPEYKIYELELEKKRKELEILKRKNLPTFQFDTRYYLYGMDQNDLSKSIGDMSGRSMNFRLTSIMPIFDGFKLKSQKQKTELEIQRLKIAKQEALSELEKKFEQIKQDSKVSQENLAKNYEALSLVNKNIEMIEQLKENKLIDRNDYLTKRAQLLTKKLELEESKIESFIAQYKMNVLKGTSSQ